MGRRKNTSKTRRLMRRIVREQGVETHSQLVKRKLGQSSKPGYPA